MLLQLEEANSNALNKLLAFAKENHLKLSLIDEDENNYILPGKPLTNQQLQQLIKKGRNSGIISMVKPL